MEYTKEISSPVGKILLASDGDCLSGLWIEGQKSFAKNLDVNHQVMDLEIFNQVENWLDLYFRGMAKEHNFPLLLKGTNFQKLILMKLTQIPYGKLITYGEIAKNISSTMSARAVGNAIANNPISIIVPCHRVVGANGKLTGYAGGLPLKSRLIELETKSSNLIS